MLERLAVRAALDHSFGSTKAGLRIVIDPMIVHANDAPGNRDSTLRESSRNAYLAQAFRARSLPRDSVLACNPRPCKLRDADVLVTLSEPAILGDKATVTVTTLRPVHLTSPRQVPIETQYQTINVRFEKRGASWQVVGFDDLGMS
ncbi:MAG: hypothetical protein ACJ796_16570 [Gemmatimonadaceae bacterium]